MQRRPGTCSPAGPNAGPDLTGIFATAPTHSIFGEWLALREVPAAGSRDSGLLLPRAEEIARALRAALMFHAIDPPPGALSGHTPDGRPLDHPHAAFVALPDLRWRRTGECRVAGAAIVLPRAIDPEERQAILLAAARWERSGLRLVLGRLGAMQLTRADTPGAGDPTGTDRWLGPSRRWASVTPIALHRNPGKLTSPNSSVAARAVRRAEEIVADACGHVALPRPASVRVMRRSRFGGVPSAPEFMPYPRKPSGSEHFRRVCVHVELEFAEEVEGPVLIGAGRYLGVGLCGVGA